MQCFSILVVLLFSQPQAQPFKIEWRKTNSKNTSSISSIVIYGVWIVPGLCYLKLIKRRATIRNRNISYDSYVFHKLFLIHISFRVYSHRQHITINFIVFSFGWPFFPVHSSRIYTKVRTTHTICIRVAFCLFVYLNLVANAFTVLRIVVLFIRLW